MSALRLVVDLGGVLGRATTRCNLFGEKIEMSLRHLELEFELVPTGDPRTGPKNKLPYIDDDGTVISDSELILQHIDAKTNGGLYGHLTDEERAVGLASQLHDCTAIVLEP